MDAVRLTAASVQQLVNGRTMQNKTNFISLTLCKPSLEIKENRGKVKNTNIKQEGTLKNKDEDGSLTCGSRATCGSLIPPHLIFVDFTNVLEVSKLRVCVL